MLKDFNGRPFVLGDIVLRSTRYGFVARRVSRMETWLDGSNQAQQRIFLDSGGKMQNPSKYIIV